MKYPIDCVFMGSKGTVVAVVENIAPGRFSRLYPAARSCLELPAGTVASSGTRVGDEIEVRDCA